jgi:DNA-directed RNA polymerase I, II, and III subunit RPABC2
MEEEEDVGLEHEEPFPDEFEEGNLEGEESMEVLPASETEIAPRELKEKRTTRYLTKYERARVLGTRALQIRFISCFKFSEVSSA